MDNFSAAIVPPRCFFRRDNRLHDYPASATLIRQGTFRRDSGISTIVPEPDPKWSASNRNQWSDWPGTGDMPYRQANAYKRDSSKDQAEVQGDDQLKALPSRVS